jgi:putative addiction module killer protein
MFKVLHYVAANGRDIFAEWVAGLKDKKARASIDDRVGRMEDGNFGDSKPVREGVFEMRVDVGPGYRVYYARAGARVILLLCGGDKRKQSADISRACKYWTDYKGGK